MPAQLPEPPRKVSAQDQASFEGAPGAVEDLNQDGAKRLFGRRRQRRTWVQGGSSVARWRTDLLGWTLVSLAAGILVSVTLNQVLPPAIGGWAAPAVLWLALLVPVVVAFNRSVPRPLLRFRATDLLYGLVLGVVLRLVQGWVARAAGGSNTWPSYVTLDGQLPTNWWFGELASGVVISPVLEEFFFRGVLLVVTYSVVRRFVGAGVGMFVSIIVSTVLFVLAHLVTVGLGWDMALTLGLVGLTCSLLVLLTGRIWGAVLVHVTFNASYVALAVIGTVVGVGGA